MFRHESQLGLAWTKQYDNDQDSRSIKLQCVSCRSSHNTLWRCILCERTRTHTRRCIDQCESLSHLRETDPRNVHPRRASECITVAHRDGFFPSLPPSRRSDATRCRGRREMHSCGNASCHSRRLPRDNKLSGLCIGRKQRRTFHMQNTCAPQVPRAPELVFVVPGAKTRPVVSSEKWSRWQSMQRFAEAAGNAALPFAPFLDRSLCLDRSIALSGESVWVSAVSQAVCDCVSRQG